MKLDFEIAVDQQTKAHDQTFEGVLDSGCPRDSHALIWSIFGSILPNQLNMLKTVLWGALLVAPQKKLAANFRIWPLNFFKGLTQNSTPKLKVEI